MTDNNLQLLDQGLDETSYHWLEDNYPKILAGIEDGLKNGAGIDEIRRRVIDRTGRTDLARRCEQAARHALQINQERFNQEFSTLKAQWGIKPSKKTGSQPEGKKVTVKEFVEAAKIGIRPEQILTGLEAIEEKERQHD